MKSLLLALSFLLPSIQALAVDYNCTATEMVSLLPLATSAKPDPETENSDTQIVLIKQKLVV